MDNLVNVADVSATHTDVHSDRNGTKTTEKTMQEVNDAKTAKLICWHKDSVHKRGGWAVEPHGWADLVHGSNNGNNRYAPRNAPIEPQDTLSRKIVFGRGEGVSRRLENIDTAISDGNGSR